MTTSPGTPDPWDLDPIETQLRRMAEHDAAAVAAVAAASTQVAAVVERVVEALRGGGRLVYQGAGSAGRYAALDADEIGPTYGVPDGTVVAVVAGGPTGPQDAADDDVEAGAADLADVDLGAGDLLVGVSASGTTPYTLAGLRAARRLGATTVALVCADGTPMAAEADLAIVVPIGTEVVRGSTRLGAGTAQKLVLNQISTLAMVRLGHVYGDLMIAVRPDNAKLRARLAAAVAAAAGVDTDTAHRTLEAADGDAKTAVVMVRAGVGPGRARGMLAAVRGDLRAALGERAPTRDRSASLSVREVDARAADARAVDDAVILRGGQVLDVTLGRWQRRDLLLVGGRVAARDDVRLGARGAGVREIDVTGRYLTPGLVDAQVNGAAGIDLTRRPELMADVAAALPAHGVTSFVPTVITAPAGTVERALAAASGLPDPRHDHPDDAPRARVIGVHAEGPFLSPQRCGAHPPAHLRHPDLEFVAEWSRVDGLVTVTVAPELPGALDLITELTGRGVGVWLGHSTADHATALAAVRAGAVAVTHLFNAMPPLDHRSPGLVGAALDDHRLVVGMIVDGHHVHPTVVSLAWKALGGKRFLLVSDTTAALGLPPGRTVLGDQDVVLDGEVVRLAGTDTLAGSGVGLDHCVRTLAGITGDTASAFVSATRVPADLLGRADLGRLEPGCAADVAIWTPDLTLAGVIIAGRPLNGASWKS